MNLIKFISIIIALLISFSGFAKHHSSYEELNKLSNKELLKLGYDYSRERNMPDSALLIYTLLTHRNAPNLSRENKLEMIESFNGLWYTYFFFYLDFKYGNQALSASLDLCEETGTSKGKTFFYLGCMYQGMSEVLGNNSLCKESQQYYKQAFHEMLKTEADSLLITIMANLITVSHMLGDTHTSAKEMDTFKRQAKELGIADNWKYQYTCQLYDGLNALEANNCEKAADIFRLQYTLSTKHEQTSQVNGRYTIFSLLNQADAYQQLGNDEKSVECLNAAMDLSIKYNANEYRLQTLDAFSRHFKNTGNYEKWIESRNNYLELKDSLLNYQQYASVKEMSMYDKMKNLDKEMAEMKHREDINNRIILVSIIIFIAIIILLSIIFLRNRYLRRINRTLYIKNTELLKAEEERRMLIKEEEALASSLAADESDENVKYRNSALDENQSDEILKKILIVMEESDEIYMPGFKIDTLASLTGVNYKHLSQVINEKRNCNFNVFLNEYRVKRACRIINTTTDASLFTIEGLANKVGFRSRNAFSSAFKKFTGMNPSAYLKMAKSSTDKC